MSVQAPGTRWYNAVWRWHFYAGLICVPFVVWLAITGTIYLWRPQVEAWLDRPYDRLVTAGPVTSPETLVAASLPAVPGSHFDRYILPQSARQATRVLVMKDGIDRRVYVDPHSLKVLHVAIEDQRLEPVVSRLHGQLLAGEVGSYVVEIAACWAVVMLLTGLYLWWPRGGRGLAGILYPRLRGGRRLFWRDIHAVAGIWGSVFALGLILTGLPWASGWGGYLAQVRHLTGAEQGPVDWTIGGKAPAPKADAMLGVHAGHEGMVMPAPAVVPGELNRVVAAVRPLRVAPPVLISPPKTRGAPWSIASDAADRPLRSDLQVDGATGQLIGRIDFAQRHWIDRIVGYGIAVHEGALFGIANQLIGTATALLLVVLAVSGTVLWWRRRPQGLLGAPLPLSRPRFGAGLVVTICTLALYMPLFGLTLLLVLLVDATALRALPGARRWLGFASSRLG